MNNREIVQDKRKFSFSRFLISWEMVLFYLFVIINLVMMCLRPNMYFTSGTVASIIRSGMDLSVMVPGMVFILLLGEIDVSVASIMILSCAVMGAVFEATSSSLLAVLCGIAAGGLCGAFNGMLVSRFKMPSVIVTIATSLLFRGIVQIALGQETLKVFPRWFSVLAWRDCGNIIPYSTLLFLAVAVIFGIVLHKTRYGREVYLMGHNFRAARYSGIRTSRIRNTAFAIMGMCAAVSGILFSGRLGGVSPGMAAGYELRVIAIAVLGGVSTAGGRGRMAGPVIATFIMAFLCKSLDLLEVHANVQKIIIGVILIIAVILPVIKSTIKKKGRAQ